MKEKRLTFHNGENRHPSYHPEGQKIVYSSSTDELKESPQFVKEALGKLKRNSGLWDRKVASFQRTYKDSEFHEIYSSHRDGSHIQRLTHSPNFDGGARYHPTGRFLIFSTVRTGYLKIFTMASNGKRQKIWSRGSHLDDEAHFSKDGQKVVWVRYSKTLGESQIYMAQTNRKGMRPLTTRKAYHRSPIWHRIINILFFLPTGPLWETLNSTL